MKQAQLVKKSMCKGYKKIYPIVYIDGITDPDTGETLDEILEKYNHIYIEWLGNFQDSLVKVPAKLRREGLYITYNVEGESYTYYYNSTDYSDNAWSNLDNWKKQSLSLEDIEAEAEAYEAPIATADVEIIGENKMLFKFGLQRGLKGDTGPQGNPGKDGTNGSNGLDGLDGKDAPGIEFIYKLTKNDLQVPDTPESVNKDKDVPEGWTDHPSGISIDMQAEWTCIRRQDDSLVWSQWSTPALWSKWGVNGRDGDGVEYIYQRTNTPIPPKTPTDVSQDDDFVPTGWTDNPTGVDINYQWEWVCTRKYKNGQWGPFEGGVNDKTIAALWAKYGQNGANGQDGTDGEDGKPGNSVRSLYAKTEGADVVPALDKTNINPGSIWGSVIPTYSGNEAIWGIQATVTYDNKLVGEWQGPYLLTGVNGKDASTPNWKTYVYYQSDTQPSKPTGNNPNPGGGWVDYPTTEGQWWQSIGSVNGTTGLVTVWSEVLPVNGKNGQDGTDGKDGQAQDGKRTEFRFNLSSSRSTAPSLNVTVREPSGWTVNPPTVTDSMYLWMTTAVINPDNTLYSNWTTPVCISGEQGPQGNTGPAGPTGAVGPQGASGVPGVGMEIRYCLGTETTYDGTYNSTEMNKREPSGWSLTTPTPTSSKLYIWAIQTRIVNNTLEDPWQTPFRLSGVNGTDGLNGKDGADGKDGTNGKNGQILYPQGIYSNTASYTCTEEKCPYVFDTSDGNYYFLNAVMTWVGTEQNNETPAQNAAKSSGAYWQKLEAFDAIYANIGIFGNALVGSAVFNGDYMFSQQGIDSSGSASSHYEGFCDHDSSNPYNPTNTFKPSYCVNLKTGEVWAGAGKIYLGSDGSGYLADKHIKFTQDGNFTIIPKWTVISPDDVPDIFSSGTILNIDKYNYFDCIYYASSIHERLRLPDASLYNGVELHFRDIRTKFTGTSLGECRIISGVYFKDTAKAGQLTSLDEFIIHYNTQDIIISSNGSEWVVNLYGTKNTESGVFSEGTTFDSSQGVLDTGLGRIIMYIDLNPIINFYTGGTYYIDVKDKSKYCSAFLYIDPTNTNNIIVNGNTYSNGMVMVSWDPVMNRMSYRQFKSV